MKIKGYRSREESSSSFRNRTSTVLQAWKSHEEATGRREYESVIPMEKRIRMLPLHWGSGLEQTDQDRNVEKLCSNKNVLCLNCAIYNSQNSKTGGQVVVQWIRHLNTTGMNSISSISYGHPSPHEWFLSTEPEVSPLDVAPKLKYLKHI